MAKHPEIPTDDEGGGDAIRRLLSALEYQGNGIYDTTINGLDPEAGIASLSDRTGIQILNIGHEFRYRDEPRLFADEQGQLSD